MADEVTLDKLTDEQRAAATHPSGPVYISSIPGSGKSTTLTARVAWLLQNDVAPNRIVAMTFTNKAANDLKDKVKKLVNNKHLKMQVSTMHSFCVKIVKHFWRTCGMKSPDFSICDDDDTKRYIIQAIATVKGKDIKQVKTDDSKFGPDFCKWYISRDKNQLIRPDDIDPNSGEDSEYTKYIIKVYREYQNILFKANSVDFDDLIMKAVFCLEDDEKRKQVSSTIEHLLVDEYQDTNISQIKLIQQLASVHRNVWAVGDKNQCLIDGTPISTPNGTTAIEHLAVDDSVVSGIGDGCSGVNPVENVFHRHYVGVVSTIVTSRGHTVTATPNHCLFVLGASVGAAGPWRFTRGAEAQYREVAIHNIYVGDTVPVLENGCITSDVVTSISSKYYQGQVHDLSVPPHLNYVAGGIVVHNSIYMFRFADHTCENKFFEYFPETKVYTLQYNFRSYPPITEVANRVIANNPQLIEKKIIPTREGGERPNCVACADPESEAHFIMEEIQRYVRTGKGNWKECAILYRTRFQSRVLEEAAVAKNIPYRVVGSLGFYSRSIIKDVIAYLKLLTNPDDNASFTRIYNTPRRGIGDVGMQQFCALADEVDLPLFRVMRKGLFMDKLHEPGKSGFRALNRLFVALNKEEHHKVAPVIRKIIELTHYKCMLEEKGTEKSLEQVDLLEELALAGETYDATRGEGIRGFLEHVMLMQQHDTKEDENVVLLMTVHAAKGLEFAKVWVAGTCDGLMPIMPREDGRTVWTKTELEKHFQEERRIFYVAVTRAKNQLTTTWALSRRTQGGTINTIISPYCIEAGEALHHLDQLGKPTALNLLFEENEMKDKDFEKEKKRILAELYAAHHDKVRQVQQQQWRDKTFGRGR